jgi:hypothetical protein
VALATEGCEGLLAGSQIKRFLELPEMSFDLLLAKANFGFLPMLVLETRFHGISPWLRKFGFGLPKFFIKVKSTSSRFYGLKASATSLKLTE